MNPVFVVGAARSGTTLLADKIMSRFPGVSYTGEIDYVWRYGQPFRSHDLRSLGKASHIKYIREWFEHIRYTSGNSIIVDKTPSNVLRIPWIKTVFPNALVIHLIRDGRAVSLSAKEEWLGIGRSSLDSQEYRQASTYKQLVHLSRKKFRILQRVRDLKSALVAIGDVPKALSAYGKALNIKAGRRTWGPRVPGLREIARDVSILDACAFQWEFCVRQGRMDCREDDRSIEIKYENLLSQPNREIGKVASLLGVSMQDDGVRAAIKGIDPSRSSGIGGSLRERKYLSALLSPTLTELGYMNRIAK